ncbi:unnamed protein product [Anisakis simplex]|uniref:Uncharacterized protein n=1 Tax=Anisakis simplex TaxID=6269 RepID=A0A0M3KEE8_ANISI|nr:unnamed protein product [Anisakis simplex]
MIAVRDSLQPSQRKVSEKIAPKISSTQENATTMKINSVEHNDEAKSADGELRKESKCSLQYCLLCEIMKSEYVQEALRRAAPDLYELAMDSVSEVH